MEVKAVRCSSIVHVGAKRNQNLQHVVLAVPCRDYDDIDFSVGIFCLAAQMIGVFSPASVASKSSVAAEGFPVVSSAWVLFTLFPKELTDW